MISAKNKTVKGNHLVELDLMKFYGILLVVLGHVAMTYTPFSLIVPNQPSALMLIVKNILYAFHMPLFMFVSGAIFAFQLEVKKKQYTLTQLLKIKAKRLMIPFYVFGLFMVWPTMILLGFRTPFHYAIDGFVLAFDSRHLWFVMALFLIFLLFYSLRWMFQKLNIPHWAIIIVAIVLYFLPISFPYFQLINVKNYFLWFVFGFYFLINRGGVNTSLP